MVEELVFNVGRKLRKVRGELGLSLRQLSEKVAVSPSTIQKIESNQISPTLATVLRIAKGLGKEIQFFLDQQHEPTSVVFIPKKHRQRIKAPDLNFGIELLTDGLSDQRFSPLILSVPPGGKRGSHLRHRGEELQHCISGKVEFTIRGKKYLLRQGDTLHFKSDIRHRWVNVGKRAAKLLMICSPPLHIGRNSNEK
ncbi:MAG: cupin domain-containing protein [candidate division NC10 bacterium]|nr:cupin domain-containing protein [candidate division NC10 bacterium]